MGGMGGALEVVGSVSANGDVVSSTKRYSPLIVSLWRCVLRRCSTPSRSTSGISVSSTLGTCTSTLPANSPLYPPLTTRPTFLDIHLTRLTNGQHTEPEFFKDIFERGIDPDMDDPTKIHAHSEVPVEEADWPLLSEVLAFRDRVRLRLRGIYDDLESGKMELTRRAGRTLFMGYEHEAQHAETLLYMLAQSDMTVPPGPKPEWEVLQRSWGQFEKNKVLEIDSTSIKMGHDDVEKDDESAQEGDWKSHEFGWDDENPQIEIQVNPFKIDALPITNGAYLEYMRAKGIEAIPAAWHDIETVRTFYGPVEMSIARDWPLMASKNEIEAYAKWKGGRLPSEAELRVLWESPEGPRADGESANIGFRHWHPIP